MPPKARLIRKTSGRAASVKARRPGEWSNASPGPDTVSPSSAAAPWRKSWTPMEQALIERRDSLMRERAKTKQKKAR